MLDDDEIAEKLFLLFCSDTTRSNQFVWSRRTFVLSPYRAMRDPLWISESIPTKRTLSRRNQ